MTDKQHKISVSSFELRHYMMDDPYFGDKTRATVSILEDIYNDNEMSALYCQFRDRFSILPCSNDQYLELIYLWCGLMGLPAYLNGSPLGWQREEFLENWTQEFNLQLDELKDFLRQHSWPLPSLLFPHEIDNSENKLSMNWKEYDLAIQNILVRLPEFQEKLKEVKSIRTKSMGEQIQKQEEIEKIERTIAAINAGDPITPNETSEERKERLEDWFQEEKLQGEHGALKRTAAREGIKRQTLSGILNR